MPEIAWRAGGPDGLGVTIDGLHRIASAAGHYRLTVAGISLGGCVEAIGTGRKGAMRRRAHAHTSGTHRGWICVLSSHVERLVTPTGRSTTLLRHEVAHIVTGEGHTAKWRAMVTAFGSPAEARKYVRGNRI